MLSHNINIKKENDNVNNNVKKENDNVKKENDNVKNVSDNNNLIENFHIQIKPKISTVSFNSSSPIIKSK